MVQPPAVHDAATEFVQFTGLLKRMWGALAGMSCLFPLSTALSQVIPVKQFPEGGFAYLPATVVTLLATIVCLFMVLGLFAGRTKYREHSSRSALKYRAYKNLWPGLISAVFYMVAYIAVRENFYAQAFGWESADIRRLLGDVLLLAAYVGMFAYLTRAFMFLGLCEFLVFDR